MGKSLESKRGSRGWSPLARHCWQTAEGFAQMAGGGGRGNANSKQALASGAGGQRGCVCQTSGLAMGRPSPVCHNAGSEPAGHVVARGGVSRSGVPKWFCRPSSAPSLHDPGSPALKNPSAFHFFSIATPMLCPPTSLRGSCCCGHPAQPSRRGAGRGDTTSTGQGREGR